jgi:SNF2 family DNA or RNA helicase
MRLRDHDFLIFYGPANDPLNSFYIPALSASVRYDRSAGFFSSTALAVAAAGVARLIRNGGRMRLLVGASLSEEDVAAIGRGHDLQGLVTARLLERFSDPQDALVRQRLEVLAWMVAEGTLEIKVVLPRDEQGLPIPAHLAQDYYHPKSGIFTDAAGDRIAFSGSVNESETAWVKNYEIFSVYFSWDATHGYLAQVATNFERLWAGQEPDWIALDIPYAVRARLLQYRPSQPPERDPFEQPPTVVKAPERQYFAGSPQAERVLFQFVRDAPFLPGSTGLAAATCAITPWPHQARVADSVLRQFPDRALLCDEVGLGKTIEAGLVIRQLLVSGRVRRCLILTPKSVLHQWQEELYEKFALDVPRYDGGKFWDVRDQLLPADNGNPWDAFPVLLAGSQLAKRADRRKQILAGGPWDLLVVDEAHHARRKDFKEAIYRPNRLLGLLNDLKERDRFTGLLLMTATPMQIHPLEVWDLLTVLGMGGRWGADAQYFLDFFSELRKPFDDRDWEFVFDLVGDHLASGGEIDGTFRDQVTAELGPVKWDLLEELPRRRGERAKLIKGLGAKAQPYVTELARRHTPLNDYIYRNTRALLREYQKSGILKASVPVRRPHVERVAMRPEEQALYDKIDEYITTFYQKYESERRGLGFVMTVYRRRLTSSFYAVRCSLERRLQYLQGLLAPDQLYDDEDDVEQEELDQDISEELGEDTNLARFAAERTYVQDFINSLKLLSAADSKLELLQAQLGQIFKQRASVLIFTQYTDTMDYLRDQLVEVYGSQVACYSGRGGEVWTGIAWAPTTKEVVKNAFREGSVHILLGTESASEGLNLQTCGVLINFDMPWNPMRVEQRIGRVDRIGQAYHDVWIHNYFYEETIEDQIYQRLADRINWFEVVVGDLQPILAEVGEITRQLAMLPKSERQARLDLEIKALRERLDHRAAESMNLDDYVDPGAYQPGPGSPVTLKQLEELLTRGEATRALFQPHLSIPEAYLLSWRGEPVSVTFSPTCVDAHPNTVQFLTYGSVLFDEILADVPLPDADSASGLVRCEVEGDLHLCDWYAPGTDGSSACQLQTFASLRDWLKDNPPAQREAVQSFVDGAKSAFAAEIVDLRRRRAEIIAARRRAGYLALRARAQLILLRAASVELALGLSPDFFDETYPTAFNDQAVCGLQRHGYPWGALLKLAFELGLAPRQEDAYFARIADEKRDALKGRFAQLKEEARKIVGPLQAALTTTKEPDGGTERQSVAVL